MNLKVEKSQSPGTLITPKNRQIFRLFSAYQPVGGQLHKILKIYIMVIINIAFQQADACKLIRAHIDHRKMQVSADSRICRCRIIHKPFISGQIKRKPFGGNTVFIYIGPVQLSRQIISGVNTGRACQQLHIVIGRSGNIIRTINVNKQRSNSDIPAAIFS